MIFLYTYILAVVFFGIIRIVKYIISRSSETIEQREKKYSIDDLPTSEIDEKMYELFKNRDLKLFSLSYKYYKKNKENGCFFLGLSYLYGIGTARNVEEAIKLFNYGTTVNDISCFYILGKIYFEGSIVNKDYNLAFKYSYIAATSGVIISQRIIGLIYYYGYGIKNDINNAIYWFQKASYNNDIVSHYKMAEIFLYGNDFSNGEKVPTNIFRGLFHLEEAAKGGDFDALSHKEFGLDINEINKDIFNFKKNVLLNGYPKTKFDLELEKIYFNCDDMTEQSYNELLKLAYFNYAPAMIELQKYKYCSFANKEAISNALRFAKEQGLFIK